MKKKVSVIVVMVLVICAVVVYFGKKQTKTEKVASSEQIVIRVWDWHVAQQKIVDEQFAKFMKENPDIKIEHNVINQEQYDNMLQLAFKSGDPPDIFMKPNSISAPEIIDKGWVQPLDEFIKGTDWMQRFPKNSFREGSNMFDGKIYTFGTVDPRWWEIYPLFWNKKLFAQAGLEGPPETWDELREHAKKLTAAGNKKSYGFIMGGKSDFVWNMNMSALANTAGASPKNDDIGFDFQKGCYDFTHKAFQMAYQLLDSMRNDGSFFPGYMALDDEQARAYFATDLAAMIIGGVWNIAGWEKYPDADYGIACLPVPGKRMGKMIHGIPGGGGIYLSAMTKHPKEAWRVLDFMSSIEYSRASVEGGIALSIFPEANQNLKNEKMLELLKVADEQLVLGPQPSLRNHNTELIKKYRSKASPIKTTFTKAVLNAWTGKIPLEQGLKRATEEANAQFYEAIELAQKDGVKISRDDWRFPDFNILEDYPIDRYVPD